MTFDEWRKHERYLERSIISLRGHMRSGRNDLKKKVEYQHRMNQRKHELTVHRLGRYELVTE